MILVKNEKDHIAYVQYSCNSGWCTVESINVVAKNNEEIDCEKLAKRLYNKYKKDIAFFYKDIEEYGDMLQKSQVRS